MQDYCIRATAADGQIRAFAAVTTNLCNEAQRRHLTYPTATAALGRVLTMTEMMGMDLQENDTLTIRVIGDGPLNSIISAAEHGGKVRGYVGEPTTHLPSKAPGKLNVGAAVGKGYLYVTKDIGLREPYTGSVPLVSGEIAEDFARYYYESEQIPSVVSLGVLVETDNHVRAAGGFLIQLMPGASEEVVSKLEKNIAVIPPISNLVDAGHTPEEILNIVLPDMGVKVLARQELYFKCNCSRERLKGILVSLGKEELRELQKQQGAEVRCHFCNTSYHFDMDEIKSLLEEADNC